MPNPPRLIDLHTDWLLQYANETTLFDASLYARVGKRVGQAEGYLGTTSAAIVACYRRAEEWERLAEPWRALDELITRIEAEFSGRLLIGRDDHERWCEDADGLTWAVIGVEGFDRLIRTADDLAQLNRLFERGVRVFQPIYGASTVLGGSAFEGDDRGLTDLGRAFLDTLNEISVRAEGARPIVDLAHLNPKSASDVLAWFEADTARAVRLIPVYSHGTIWHAGFPMPRAITVENATRLRALGGVIGVGVTPPFFANADALKAAIEAVAALPFQGRIGYEGIAIGTDFLGVDETLPGLGNAPDVVAWLNSAFATDTAQALIQKNAAALFARMTGASGSSTTGRSAQRSTAD